MLDYEILFFLLSILLVFSVFMVVVSKHPVLSLLFLVASFLLTSYLLFLVGWEFLAILFVALLSIIIYVGAIVILSLFAVMMLESKFSKLYFNMMRLFLKNFR
jgi:NADH-quinone oxidoreductase subunit J